MLFSYLLPSGLYKSEAVGKFVLVKFTSAGTVQIVPSVAVIEPRPETLMPFEYKFSVVVEAKPVVTDAVP